MIQKIVLDPGEIVCPKCEGRGHINIEIKTGFNTQKRKRPCQKCGGFKKIDWIQNATGYNKIKDSILEISGSEIKDTEIPKVFKIEDCDPDELNQVYYKIVENLNR